MTNKFSKYLEQVDVARVIAGIVALTLGAIGFINISETQHNRSNGYKNRAVICAVLKSQVIDQDPGFNDPFITNVYHDQCEEDPAITERYPSAVRK